MRSRGFALPRLLLAVALTLLLPLLPAAAADPADPNLNPNANLAPPPPNPDAFILYSSFEFVKDAHFFYGGAIAALNGDIGRRGFLIQGFGGVGGYEYLNSGVPGGKVEADLTEASGLLGYQFYTGNMRFMTFVGVDWQDNDLHPPDPANPVSGSQTGVLVTASIKTVNPSPFYFDLYGSFANVNNTYWSKARVGYNFGRFIIGPEGAFYGNENFNSQRAGAFIKFPLLSRLDVTLAGGFNFVANNEFFDELGSGSFGGLGGIVDSGYGNISLSTWF